MTDRLSLPPRYRRMLEALLCKHVPDAEVWAYGSRINGESHDGSDLDMVVRGPALEELGGDFHDLVEAIQKSNIPILVQAHDWAHLPESFHREIEQDYVVVQDGATLGVSNGWHEVTLGDVVRLHTEQVNPAHRPDTLFRHFSIPAFDESCAPANEFGANIGSNKFTVPADSILVSRLNPRISRVWEPTVENGDFAIASTEFLVLLPRGGRTQIPEVSMSKPTNAFRIGRDGHGNIR